MTQVYHQAKFRWTENLTCRFIQLRKENGKLFTGRKYSAQAGWEYENFVARILTLVDLSDEKSTCFCDSIHILRQMRQEFPTIMADVHYRVLKKKWSNLLQQYKELKNPVHGDKNRADDVSWPFYNAIDEVLGKRPMREPVEYEDIGEELMDPNEFLCVSVTPEESGSPLGDATGQLDDNCSIKTEKFLRQSKPEGRINLGKRLLQDERTQIRKTTKRKGTVPLRVRSNRALLFASSDEEEINVDCEQREAKRSRRAKRNEAGLVHQIENSLEVRIDRFIDYTTRRDAENRNILLRILQAVEKIAEKIK